MLARTPDAPAGRQGHLAVRRARSSWSTPTARLGARNDVRCVSLEHKLGIHASPTAVLAFGDNGGAVGYLVGEENRGLEYMFIMMNAARFGVGIAGRRHRRARLPARARLRARARAGRDAGDGGDATARSSAIPTCAAC